MVPWPGLNARRLFDPEKMAELSASIAEDGLGQPIGVKLCKEPPHWIYAGERRWRAAEGLLDEMPVLVRDITEEAAIRMNLVENVQRNDLTAIEEGHALSRYLDATKKTQKVVAEEIGKTQAWVSNRVRLLRMPGDLQVLSDDGAFTASQARDLILPFGKLPDELWEVLTGSVEKALRKLFKKEKEVLKDEQIRMAVSKVAMAMSSWLDYFDYNHDDQDQYPSYIHIPKDQWGNAPKGTVVSYLYGLYPNRPSSRAFHPDWWQQEMALAQVASKEERKAMEEGALGEEGGDLQWSPALGEIPEDVEIPHGQVHAVFVPVKEGLAGWQYRDGLSYHDYAEEGALFADPTMIPDEYLVVQARKGGDYHQPRILCTSEEVFKAAEESLAQKKKQLVARRIARAAKQDVDKSSAINLHEAYPTLVVVGTLLPEGSGILEAAIKALGIKGWKEIEEELTGDWEEWTEAFHHYLVKMKKADRESLLKLLVYRLLRAPDGSEMDPSIHAEKTVAAELRTKLVKELTDKITLPVWKEEAPAEADTTEPEGEEE